jgi:hypothetical protein
MSAFASESSANHDGGSLNGRPKVSPKYPNSTRAKCLTSPSRFVPVGTIGRRMPYPDRPSSFHSTASRPACKYRWRSAFGSGAVTGRQYLTGRFDPTSNLRAHRPLRHADNTPCRSNGSGTASQPGAGFVKSRTGDLGRGVTCHRRELSGCWRRLRFVRAFCRHSDCKPYIDITIRGWSLWHRSVTRSLPARSVADLGRRLGRSHRGRSATATPRRPSVPRA